MKMNTPSVSCIHSSPVLTLRRRMPVTAPSVADYLVSHRVPDDLGIRTGHEAVLDDLLGAQFVTPMHQIELASEAGKEEALLHRRITATNDRNHAVAEKGAVAHGAVRDAATSVFELARDVQRSRRSTGRDDHSTGTVLFAIRRADNLLPVVRIDFRNLRSENLSTERLGVGHHLLDEDRRRLWIQTQDSPRSMKC